MVVPFVGRREALQELRKRLGRIRLRPGDSVLVVDNTPNGEELTGTAVPVCHFAERQTPGYARNRGAARGSAAWLVFLDADTEPPEDLLDRYFDPSPDERAALIGGGVRDEPVSADGAPAARYSHIRGIMSQEGTWRFGEWGYPKTANAAVRRVAFEASGGFREDIRAAEDADLAYRLRAAGWTIERRENATVIHRSRPTLRAFARQKALHGAGGAWLEREYPGSFPARRRPGLVWWALRTAVRRLFSAIRTGDRDTALWALLDPLETLAWEFGRSLPNERPLTAAVWWQALRRLRSPRHAPRV